MVFEYIKWGLVGYFGILAFYGYVRYWLDEYKAYIVKAYLSVEILKALQIQWENLKLAREQLYHAEKKIEFQKKMISELNEVLHRAAIFFYPKMPFINEKEMRFEKFIQQAFIGRDLLQLENNDKERYDHFMDREKERMLFTMIRNIDKESFIYWDQKDEVDYTGSRKLQALIYVGKWKE